MEEIKKEETLVEVKKVEEKKGEKKSKKMFLKTFLSSLITLVVLVLLFLLGPGLWQKLMVKGDVPYSAVFLDNGQVYFGKVDKEDKEEIVLREVYYLQITDGDPGVQKELTQTHLDLIKLGTELHKPVDLLKINRAHVVFSEELKPDSKIVESINNSAK